MKKRGKKSKFTSKSKKALSKLKKKSKGKVGLYLFVFLLTINVVLAGLTVAKSRGLLIPGQPDPVVVNNVVDLDDLTLEQKIAQMVVVLGVEYYSTPLRKMQLGGIHLHAMKGIEQFHKVVGKFQEGMEIPFFVTVDLEGCVNPFSSFMEFQLASEVESIGDSFQKGKSEGKFLSELGATINFAPVVDLDDQIWNCRSFKGDKEKVSELANAYVLGLQDEGIIATAKHYPGKTLVIKDPHKFLAAAEITEDDLYPYDFLIEKDSIKAIMISHLITYGKVNSEGKPSDASQRITDELIAKYDGLIVTDEINMLGMRNFYGSLDEMYLEVFKAGPDIVLNFNSDPNEIYRMILLIKEAVKDGDISEKRIDKSVKKILEAKGFIVKD
ncbi:glycoside hydrolase family 3 protein [Candidatus Woesearchaeota archaeon]|nr:glycoside hydrolase family 3 protein [Candidatus Woesearchaeota archaeon]